MNSNFIIETERFIIKELKLINVNRNYLSWFNNDLIKKYILTSKIIKDIESLKMYVSKKIKKKNIFFLGVFTKNKRHIGNIKFEQNLLKRKIANVGFLIGDKNWRHKGVLTEIFNKTFDFLFKNFGISRLELGVDRNNKKAILSYRKIGFKFFRSKISKNNKNSFFMYREFNS